MGSLTRLTDKKGTPREAVAQNLIARAGESKSIIHFEGETEQAFAWRRAFAQEPMKERPHGMAELSRRAPLERCLLPVKPEIVEIHLSPERSSLYRPRSPRAPQRLRLINPVVEYT